MPRSTATNCSGAQRKAVFEAVQGLWQEVIVLLFAWIWSLEAMGVMKLLSEGGAESQNLRLAVVAGYGITLLLVLVV